MAINHRACYFFDTLAERGILTLHAIRPDAARIDHAFRGDFEPPSPLRALLSRERTQVIQMTQVRSLESRVPETSKGACAASTCYDSGKFSRDSPALRGEG